MNWRAVVCLQILERIEYRLILMNQQKRRATHKTLDCVAAPGQAKITFEQTVQEKVR